MTPNLCFKAKILILGAAWFTGLSLISPTFANSYIVDLNSKEVIDLGDVFASAINDAGQVAGQKAGHAFITGQNGIGIRDIGTLGGVGSSASGINDVGQVVGWSDTPGGARHAFITGPDGVGVKDLGFPESFGNIDTVTTRSSSASAINNAGQVVGWYDGTYRRPDSPLGEYLMHAFITDPNGAGMRDLTGFPPFSYIKASGINAAGQVADDQNDDTFSTVFITGPNGTGITRLEGLDGLFDYASGINDAGQVIGTTATGFSSTGWVNHAFVTGPSGVGIKDLGTLGGDNSRAFGINNAGQVVGGSETAEDGTHAFITTPDGEGMRDLNSLVELPHGVILTQAMDINNSGQLIAVGSVIPEPKTYAVMLAGLGLISIMARRKQNQIE